MTISSSLNAGVAGLNVNANKLATISDNIANSQTIGYKRADTDFSSLVLTERKGTYTAGGVRSESFRLVDQQGGLRTTSNPTDLALGGRGFFPVTDIAAVGAQGDQSLPLKLVTTGSFRPDENGILRTTSGLALLGWPADPDGTIPDQPRDSSAGLEPVAINRNQFANSPTENIRLGVNLPANATQAGATGATIDLPVEYFDNIGASQTLTMSFTPTVPPTGSSNTWTLSITDSDTPAANNPIGVYTLTFDGARGAGGAITNVATVSGGAYVPATGVIGLTVGVAPSGGPMNLDIGTFGELNQMSQLSAEFAPVSITKDGAPVGNLFTVSVDENGIMQAIYDTGFARTIYQIPVADVSNPNGLRAADAQAFAVSQDSGSLFLWDAGDGPTGGIVGNALEESTTDIAGELTQLIQTQRAYSSNARVIQTVDEMLQETTNIIR